MSQLSRRQMESEATHVIETRPFDGLMRLQPYAAGMDIGAHEIFVCVPGADNTQLVRAFGNYTHDLEQIADWLHEHQIVTAAMESTGVYWIPIFELLETRGFQCCLISAASSKRIPGRKSDVLDCQWLQTLHSYGLLADSFRPEADLVALRTLRRHRAQLVEHRSPHILHMHKALLHMNLQLSQVVTDVTGETGLAIIRAIVAGERNPHTLAALRNYRCHKGEEEIAQALTGTWRTEHLFVLAQALALYDFYTQQIQACDQEIERTYAVIRPERQAPPPSDPPAAEGRRRASRETDAERRIRRHLQRIAGVDLVAVDGLDVNLVQTILAEAGTDMSRFPTDKHFCSWLGLAPHNDISGGKVLRSRTRKNHNRAGQAFRLAASAVSRSNNVFGVFYRRLKSRIGPAQAIVATAHKIARMVYHMLKTKTSYQAMGTTEYASRLRENEIRHLTRKAARLGLALTPLTGAIDAVS